MKSSVRLFLLMTAVVVLAYAAGFHAPFIFDDVPNIVENADVRDLSALLAPHQWKMQRYVAYVTFAADYAVHGLDAAWFRTVNLAIHVLNGLLVYLLTVSLFRTPFLARSSLAGSAERIGLAASLFFLVHPLQIQAVTYVVQRMTSLATGFFLLSILCYLHARLASGRARQGAFLVFSFLAAVLAMKTKEIAFTLPFVAAAMEFSFFTGPLRKRLLWLSPLFITLAVIPLGLIGIDKPVGEMLERANEATRTQSLLSRSSYLYTQFRVIPTYLRLFAFPVNLAFDYSYPSFDALMERDVLLSLILLCLLASAAAYLYRVSVRGADAAFRLAAFGFFWFIATLSVESGVIPIADLIMEHRMYLPSVGLFIMAASVGTLGLRRLREVWPDGARFAAAGALCVFVLLTAATIGRNRVWADEVALWEDNERKHPGNMRVHYGLGNAYFARGRFGDAGRQYLITLSIWPNYPDAHNNLGNVYRQLGQLDRAIEEYRTAVRIMPRFPAAHYNLGNAYIASGLPGEAILHYQDAIRYRPDYTEAMNNLGNAFVTSGRLDEGIAQYQRVISLRPDFVEAYSNLGNAYAKKGEFDRAIGAYRNALALNPAHENARHNLSVVTRMKEGVPAGR